MAKWTFEDYANGAMAVVGIALFANQLYQAKKQADREDDRRAANRWIDQASARLDSMVGYMQKEGATKECWVEALTAAKNVIQFEVRDQLHNNYHLLEAESKMIESVDRLIAKVK